MNISSRIHSPLAKLNQRNIAHISKKLFYSMENNRVGPVQKEIQKKLTDTFAPTVVEVVNESYKHSVPSGSETHFKVLIVSQAFKGKTPIQRHRIINTLLEKELSGPVHALSIQAKTPEQWEKSDQVIQQTPNCLGGSKHTT